MSLEGEAIMLGMHFRLVDEHKEEKGVKENGWRGCHERSDYIKKIFTPSPYPFSIEGVPVHPPWC